MKKFISVILLAAMCLAVLTSCDKKKERVVIYTSKEDYIVEYMTSRLKEEFPDYDIVIEYMSTGNHAAKLKAEGTATECDITHDLEYAYLQQLEGDGVLADLSGYDHSIYCDDVALSKNYIIECRNGGAIIVNTKVLADRGLSEPTSYKDLLKPEYKDLISMPNPKSSGTGYMFLKNLINVYGEDEAFEYFDKLSENILQFTSSGSGPVNALVQEEAAIGLGMTAQAVTQINDGVPLKILYFKEGSPFSLYGQGIIKGKETRKCVKEVFDFMINTFNYEDNEKYYPEQIFKDTVYSVENYPTNIVYGDMSDNTIAEKDRILGKWAH